ncbi:hypothetical protein GOP47_0025626 [Adiantum capillus-veneris]|uniref:HECT-type E3 ubiquitin transferase n=1 Tax=Adiantum capillus-veneris TaxID=13818 RepID=A0A9D4U198_ADICA|nr:hypothetical protein GOP47_0025626 [Adiantum capillus-veneris]
MGKEDGGMEQQGNERSMQASIRNSSAAAEEKDSVTERVSTGLWQSRHSIIRMIPVKRKLEELELGADSSSASQARIRRESRDDYIDACDSFICERAQSLEEVRDLHMDENLVTLPEINCNLDLSLGRETSKVPNLDINTGLASLAEEFSTNKLSKEFSSHLEIMELGTEDLWAVDLSDCMSSESGKMKSETAILKSPQFSEPEAAQKARPEHCMDAVCQETTVSIEEIGLGSSDENGKNLDNGRRFNMLLQFFVKTYMDGRTIVLYGNASDTIESVHRQISLKTGLPLSEQRLIYFGRQLQQDQTLADCHITNDATLHLVARMRSTALPHSWQLINDLVATIRGICSMGNEDGEARYNLIQAQLSIRACVKDFFKMATKSASFSEHMQIFQLAGATSALIMLLLSPIESNGETAEESIRLFFCTNEDCLPAQLHSYCVPVLLDFCKLLAKSAPAHSLYPVCRNALACLLDMTGPVQGSSFFQDVKADAIVNDFSPFVNELSVSLISNLRWTATQYSTKGRSSHMSTYVKDGQDFTAFVTLLCKAFEALKDSGDSCSFGGSENDVVKTGPIYGQLTCMPKEAEHTPICLEAAGDDKAKDSAEFSIGSQKWLQRLFQELLQAVDGCLAAIRPTQTSGILDEKTFWWAPFLIILKGLNSVVRVYGDAFTELLAMVQTHQITLNMLVKHSRWQDDHSWLLDYKQVLNFESKRKLAMAMLPEPQDDHEERQEIAVTRSSLLSESFEMLAYADPDALQGGISLEFISEEATGPGVLREWFFLVCREIFNPQNALFKSCLTDGRRVFPNAASSVNPGHLMYFRFCGRVIALALMHRVQVNVAFSSAFFKQLAGRAISWQDTKDADPIFYESCLKVLDMDAEEVDADALGLTFVCEEMQLGAMKTVELCAGGKDLQVNSQNRQLYLEYLVQQRFVNSVAEQVKSFSQGFSELLSTGNLEQFLQGLEVEDFNLILHGNEHFICLDDWKLHTEYHEYIETDDQIIWFWQVLESMTNEQRRRLLFFSTSLRHLPAEGFAGLHSKFHIHKGHTDTTWLPTAHTCFFQLILPPYPSMEVMREKLFILTEEHVIEGFGFA